MKQLLIVKSGTKLNKKADGSTNISTPADLPVGGIAINKLYGDGALLASNAAAAGNFTIALGRPNGQRAFIIPEVDFNSLTVTKASFSAGVAMVAQVTINQSTKDVGFAIVKKDVVPHQRNMLSFSVPGTDVAATDATTLKDQAENRINVMGLPFTISRNSATLTITCTEVGAMYTIAGIGDVTVNTSTGSAHPAEPAIGDKKYIQNLASQCAAGKGFEHTAPEGREFIPGYPEEVENKDYWVYTLRFAVHRDSAKTRDEVVSQLVHIAIPNKHTAGTGGAADTDEPEISLDTIFGSKLIRS